MAFSKTPTIDTHTVKRIPAVGSQTHTSNTRNWSVQQGQRFINCYPQPSKMLGDDPDYHLRKAPGLVTKSIPITITPATTGRIDCFDNDTYLFCKDKYIYQLTSAGDVALKATHGTSDTVFKSIQKVLDYSGAGHTIVCGVLQNSGGYYAYSYDLTSNTLTTSGTPVVSAANGCTVKSIFVDGYHIMGDLTTSRIYNNQPPGSYTSFASTDYYVPEMESDDLVDVHKHKNTICAIGRRSIEFHYDNANAVGSPFSRMENLTIKTGCISQTKTLADGDDIYFIGGSPNSGINVFRIRDYKLEQISDDYIDFLLNNLADIGGAESQGSASLGMVDLYGNVCFGFTIKDQTAKYRSFIFNEATRTWWEWTASNNTGLTGDTQLFHNIGGRPIYINTTYIYQLYWESGYAPDDYVRGLVSSSTDSAVTDIQLTSNSLDLTYFTKNPTFTSSSAEFYTDMFDFDSNNYKHIKYVDAIGDYGDNTVEVAFTKDADYSNWSSLTLRDPNLLGMNNPIRWRNLCMTNRLALRFRLTGSSDFAHRAIDIAYNLHTK